MFLIIAWTTNRYEMMFAIKAKINVLSAETFAFIAQKTMYGGKHVTNADTIGAGEENVYDRGVINAL